MRIDVHIIGTIYTEPIYNHTVCNEKIYLVFISTKRLSGYEDMIPVQVSERLLKNNLEVGQRIEIKGSFRNYSYRRYDGQRGSKLYVFANDIQPREGDTDKNITLIEGYICKEPVYRHTPSGRDVTETTLKVQRYNNFDYIPCISWGRNAKFMANMILGDYIEASGRIQSRAYKKIIDGNVIEKTAYEVSISYIHFGENKNSNNKIKYKKSLSS